MFRRSKYQGKLLNLPHVPPPPLPENFLIGQISHSLPLGLHLINLLLYSTARVIYSVISHLIGGGLKMSWSLSVTACHSVMKSAMECLAPQARHSVDFVNLITSFSLPDFLFIGTKFTESHVRISGSERLRRVVMDGLRIDNSLLLYHPSENFSRSLDGEWVHEKGMEGSNFPVVIFLHGGAHTFCSPNTHRIITSRVARAANAKVYAVNYRLSPQAPYPSAVVDALATYISISHAAHIHGVKAEVDNYEAVTGRQIFLMGDSSGASLVMQTIQVIKALGLPKPAGACLLSPFLDKELKSDSWKRNFRSDFLSLDFSGVDWAITAYSNGLDRSHPSLTVTKADLGDLPPILIQAGDSEVVFDDAVDLYHEIQSIGGSIELQVFKDMFHVFMTFPFIPQAEYSMKRIAHFIATQSIELHDTSNDVSSSDGDTIVGLSNSIFIDEHGESELYRGKRNKSM